MKKLVYMKQGVQNVVLHLNGICSYCGEKKDCVAVNGGGYAMCKDCSKQITRIITKHGPAAGQVPEGGTVPF